MGKRGGVCGGRGGSQHLYFDNFYSNGVQGGIVPVATGMALAEKHNGSGAVATVFLGDGTLGEGVIYEAFNIASLWRLPIVFVVEHNGYAQSTPAALQIAGDVAARPRAFGIETRVCESPEVHAIGKHAVAAIDAARAGGGPQCVVAHTYRLGPHSKGDDNRDPEELKAAWLRDPLVEERSRLQPGSADLIEASVRTRVETARLRAIESER
jgi:TPP-dependent pyruvate/acetoin dehydrogenase alpha subunit